MKFGETFSEYLHGEQERFLHKCSHLEYKQLKKVLKKCRHGEMRGSIAESCVKLPLPFDPLADKDDVCGKMDIADKACSSEACPVCDQDFFSELTSEISAIAGFFSSRARHLLHMHLASGFQRYFWRLRHCFADDHLAMIQECQSLLSYVAMNAIAIRKILKKYDKVHCSVNGRNFKTKLQAKHIELLQSPWLIELSAFQINARGSECGGFSEVFCECSCDFSGSEPVITCTLSDCVCTAASIPIIEGIKAAKPCAKCPICRQKGVYEDSVHLAELDLLVKKRCKGYWKERLYSERAEKIKQAKEYWDMQTNFVLGFV
eukprot:Gb_14146 [translate_table: standard]